MAAAHSGSDLDKVSEFWSIEPGLRSQGVGVKDNHPSHHGDAESACPRIKSVVPNSAMTRNPPAALNGPAM